MASRKEQKEAARQRRLAEERARAERAAKARRLQMLGGVVVAAAIVVVVLIVVSSGGGGAIKVPKPNSAQARQAVATVDRLLAGIPQQGMTLGSPSAKVTVTEYGDLVCPVCKDFALGSESQLISHDVRAGRVKLVYKALETASFTANNSMFVPGQAAARAAGEQNLGWNYIELFYHEQGDETSSYVTPAYLEGLAEQIKGLDFSKWSAARQSGRFTAQINAEGAAGAAADNSVGQQPATPTIVVTGPKAQAQPIVGPATYGSLQAAIRSVS